MTKKTFPTEGSQQNYPVLPLRDIVVFPHMIVPLFVGREKSIRALEEVIGTDRQILLLTQKNATDDDPQPDAIFEVGTAANVLQLLKLPDGTRFMRAHDERMELAPRDVVARAWATTRRPRYSTR